MNELQYKNQEGINLYAIEWPVADPVAVIALVHGQGEHIGRYHHLAAWYNARKIAVVGFDQQGYGRSGGNRGHVRDLEAFLQDIGLHLEKTRELYPGKPLFLYGHSMGGGLCLNYVARKEPQLAGLIVTGPWIRLAFPTPTLKVIVGRLLRNIVPKLALPTGLNANHISRDEAVVNAYKNDPLVHDKLSVTAGIELMEGAAWLDKWQGAFKIPVLIQHGADDQLTSAAASKEFAARVKGDVTYKSWPGLYHEIHNEKEQGEVFLFTYEWMALKFNKHLEH